LEYISVPTLLALLVVLYLVSGLITVSETALLTCNRLLLNTKAKSGHAGAKLSLSLLEKTGTVLGGTLLWKVMANTAIAALSMLLTLKLFVDDYWTLTAAFLVVSLSALILVELIPKAVGTAYADSLSRIAGYILTPLLRLGHPLVSALNLLVNRCLRSFRVIDSTLGEQGISPEELRTIVLESVTGIPPQHRRMLLNLFDLEQITVDDVMTPRGEMEVIDLHLPLDEIRQQIATSYHTRLPVHDGDPGNILGILHQRRLLSRTLMGTWDRDTLRGNLAEPYFIPSGTHVYSQLQFFKENRQRMGLVVDEYGEILGLLTLEDIIEEIVGKFTTSASSAMDTLLWASDGTVVVDGSRPLRELNRALALALPLEGPKTLNGLILEHFQDIPESGVSALIGGVQMEVLQTQDKSVRIVKLIRPGAQGQRSSRTT
jgi:Mg2+/Co2+ transporter CorB